MDLHNHPLGLALALPGLLYLGLCLGYFLFHRFFILHPDRRITRTPKDAGLDYEEIFFPAADGVMLQGWYLPAPPVGLAGRGAPRVILFLPGNEGALSKFVFQMVPLHALGLEVLMLSYRGFGKSRGRFPSEHGLRQDVRGAWRWLVETRKLSPRQIILYGQSLGGGLASWAAAEFHPAALVLEGGFSSVPDLAGRAVPWLPLRWLTTERFDTLRHLPRVSCPVLIAHSQDDRHVPLAVGERLFARANPPKDWLALRGGHARGWECMPREFAQALSDFLQRRLP